MRDSGIRLPSRMNVGMVVLFSNLCAVACLSDRLSMHSMSCSDSTLPRAQEHQPMATAKDSDIDSNDWRQG